MAKQKQSVFFCKECGYESAKWMGQCPGCGAWGSFSEEPVVKVKQQSGMGRAVSAPKAKPRRIQDVSAEEEPRFSSGFAEMDRVLGGGVVRGSLILVGGDPGIGKSTLLLQSCKMISEQGKKVLYVSGEESARQIRMRADRIGTFTGSLELLAETNLDVIEGAIAETKPDVAVIDSIQTMYREDVASAPGSVSQVRESTNSLLKVAKEQNITIFLVGHVTKEGMVAGPRMLEHMVDTVLYFEGDKNAMYRMLRAVKNRFGATNEMGVFEMVQEGLREVENPSAFLLEGRPEGASGTVTSCLMEGNSPLMLEIQALVCRTNFGMPRRTSNGIDYNRVNLLMAVLEKRLGYGLSDYDAYVNVTGGLRVSEPAIDLAVVAALVSSLKDRVVDSRTLLFGEVGLAGEVRSVSLAQKRVNEAAKLGFTRCILPRACMRDLQIPDGLLCIPVENVKETVTELLR